MSKVRSLSTLQVPVDLVIDHSVQVDLARSENAVQANMELEFYRNKERFAFLKWGSTAFQNMLVVPPGSGIVHQVLIIFSVRLGGHFYTFFTILKINVPLKMILIKVPLFRLIWNTLVELSSIQMDSYILIAS